MIHVKAWGNDIGQLIEHKGMLGRKEFGHRAHLKESH